MMKNLLCSALLKKKLESFVLFAIIKLIIIFNAFKIEERHKLQALMFKMIIHVTTEIAMRRRTKNKNLQKQSLESPP